MIVTAVYTACFDVLMTLSPSQRWSAMRQFNVDVSTEKAVILICVAAIVLLAVSFYFITHKKRNMGSSITDKLFNDYVQSCGLNEYQSYLLSELARYLNLKKKELLFTLADVFDRGLQAFTTSNWFMAKDQQNKQQLIEELTVLREKIGFNSESKLLNKAQRIEVSQLSVGQELFISHSRVSNSSVIKAKLVKNERNILTVKTEEPVAIFSGQNWYVRFSFLECIWEFDVTVLSCYDNILVLSHDNSIRFASRRHFHAVETDLPGLIANFPFAKKVTVDDTAASCLKKPEFVGFKVKKIAGPYLNIETDLKIFGGSRVVLIFEQISQKKILQSTAVVKNVQENGNVFCALVELTVLAKSDMNELICAANAADSKPDVVQEQERLEFDLPDFDEAAQEIKAGQEN